MINTNTERHNMTHKRRTQEEKIKYAQSVYSLMDKIAGEIHDQHELGSDDWQREIAEKWTPLKEMFAEYVHKHNIHKSYYR